MKKRNQFTKNVGPWCQMERGNTKSEQSVVESALKGDTISSSSRLSLVTLNNRGCIKLVKLGQL